MSDSIRNPAVPPGGDESKLPSAFRKRKPGEGGASKSPRSGAFEAVFGEELGSVQRQGRREGEGEPPAVESLLISRNLGALYRSFLNME